MLIKRSFLYAQDQDSHENGWKPAKIPEFNAGQGYHVAHDTLEHFEDTNVGFHGEMRAFGATMYLRAEGYYWQGEGVFEHISKILRNDFVAFLAQSGSELTDPGDVPTTTPYVEDIIQGLQHWASTVTDRDGGKLTFTPQLLAWAAGWIRKGYHESAIKYAGIPQPALSKLFKDVIEAVDGIDKSTLHYGDTLTVKVNTKRLTVNVKVDDDGKRAGNPIATERQPGPPGFAEFIRAITGDSDPADIRRVLERIAGK